MPEPEFRYDVFISYSHKDGEWVTRTLLPRLEKEGLKVCIDQRDFTPGKAALLNMQDGIRESRHILLVLTPNWVESSWTQFEAELARTSDPEGIKARTIPLLWKRCALPEHIAMLTYVDFTRKETLDLAWWNLLKALGVPEENIRAPKKVHPGRHKPKLRRRPRSLSKRWKNLLQFSAIGLSIVTLTVMATIWSVLRFSPPPDAAHVVTDAPTETSSPTLTQTLAVPSSTQMPSLTPSETASPTLPGTATFTLVPGCINAQTWTAFTTDKKYSSFQPEGKCWSLSDWGISLYAGEFSFLDNAFPRAEKYGLLRSVPWSATIEFTLNISYLRDVEIWMGITKADDAAHDGVFFVRRPNGLFDVRTVDEAGRIWPYSNGHKIDSINNKYIIKMVLAGERLTIYVNGLIWSLKDIPAPYKTPRFYLGYQSLPNGQVNVKISVPTVTENTPR